MSTKDTDCTGTARALHEISEYEMLEFDYDEETALSVTTKAFQRSFPDITRDDVKSTVKVIKAMRTGKVDVAAERQRTEDRAQKATSQIIQDLALMETNEA